MHPYVLSNDEIVRSDEKILLPGQLGLLAGWGVFTTLRIYEGVPFAFERHWQRMERDASLVHVELPRDGNRVRDNLLRLIDANSAREAVMRLCVFRSQGGFWAGPGTGNASDLVALTSELEQWQESVALGVADEARHAESRFRGTKTLSWAHNLTIRETAEREGFGEVILLNEREEVAECTSANIFAVVGGKTYTPPLESGPLPGVTRAVMLEELEVPDAPVTERVLRLDDLFAADEVFITSTTRELMPVHQVGERRISAGGPGAWPVMEKLRAALRSFIRAYIEEAKRGLTTGE